MIGVSEITAVIKRLEKQNLQEETDMELSIARERVAKLFELSSKVYSEIIDEQCRRTQLEIEELKKQG